MDRSQEIDVFVGMAKTAVRNAIGITPDLTPDTLPLVDAYIQTALAEMAADDRIQMVSAIGCYFGEVARRVLGGSWNVDAASTHEWRIELASAFLYFCPVGMTGEVLLGCETAEYDGTFGTDNASRANIEALLAQASPLPEEQYFSLAGRLEVLQMVSDWLVGLKHANSAGQATYRPEDYARHYASVQNPSA